ncbi:MAG TPA: nicotinamide mononucleotide transporter, partial [Bacteroidia bacterium]
AVFFFKQSYPGSGFLNIIYAVQGIIGFFNWRFYDKEFTPSFKWNLFRHLLAWVLCFSVFYFVIQLAASFNFNEFSNTDILLACFCILATTLEIKKDTSCWYYWIVCNLSYAFLYYQNPNGDNMFYYATLMLFLAGFSYFALRAWKNVARSKSQNQLQSEANKYQS